MSKADKVLYYIINSKRTLQNQIQSKICLVWKIKLIEKTMESPKRAEAIDRRITITVFGAIGDDYDQLIVIEVQDFYILCMHTYIHTYIHIYIYIYI